MLPRLIFVHEKKEGAGEDPYLLASYTVEDATPDGSEIRTVGLYKLVQVQRIKRATQRLSSKTVR